MKALQRRSVIQIVLLLSALLLAACAPRSPWTHEAKAAFAFHSAAAMSLDVAALEASMGQLVQMQADIVGAKERLDKSPVPDFMAVYHAATERALGVCDRMLDSATRETVQNCQDAVDAAQMEEARIVAEYGHPFPELTPQPTEKAGE